MMAYGAAEALSPCMYGATWFPAASGGPAAAEAATGDRLMMTSRGSFSLCMRPRGYHLPMLPLEAPPIPKALLPLRQLLATGS